MLQLDLGLGRGFRQCNHLANVLEYNSILFERSQDWLACRYLQLDCMSIYLSSHRRPIWAVSFFNFEALSAPNIPLDVFLTFLNHLLEMLELTKLRLWRLLHLLLHELDLAQAHDPLVRFTDALQRQVMVLVWLALQFKNFVIYSFL